MLRLALGYIGIQKDIHLIEKDEIKIAAAIQSIVKPALLALIY